MTPLHQAAHMALDALIYHRDQTRPIERSDAAITALREALAQPVPEPVAWCELTPNGSIAYFDGKPMVMCGPVGNECHTTPLYAAAPAMLQALEEMLEVHGVRWEHVRGDSSIPASWVELSDKARAAIKAAKGEA